MICANFAVDQTVGWARGHAVAAADAHFFSFVNKVARDIIAKAGYGKQFGHGLGHGLGLAIHESPRLAPDQDVPLRPGMIVTVEPGIYFPDWGGVRIEDDVLVTRAGHEVLTDVEKDLDACIVG